MRTLLTSNKLFLACLLSLLNSCSSLTLDTEKITDVLTWGEDKVNSLPKNAVAFECEKSKDFHMFFLENDNAVWVVLKNREFRLNKDSEQTNVYTNGDTVLELKPNNTVLTIQKKPLYDLCKEKKSTEG
ncbi:MAG: hypothetical protein HN470_00295 [Nitrosomonadales bacterium]|nr:hypothetical protein [Nitrosomonadales bacterium]